MSDVTVTLSAEERWALDKVAVMAIERRPLPSEWYTDGTLAHALASASTKLRAAQPAEPSPLERLEVWLRAHGGVEYDAHEAVLYALRSDGDVSCVIQAGRAYDQNLIASGNAATLSAAIDGALRQAEEASE